MRIRIQLLLVLAVLSLRSAWVAAQIIPVPNASFESPDVVLVGQGSPALPFAFRWITIGPNMQDIGFGFPVSIGTGVFPNPASGPAHFTNADAAQLAYIFPTTGHSFSQPLTTVFEEDKQYSLTVGLGLATTSPSPTSQFELALYYVTPGDVTMTPNILASKIVTNDAQTGLTGSVLTDFTATSDLLTTGNPAIGQPINILLRSLGSTSGGQFDFDNVRLVAVPEPGSLVILGAATMLVFSRKRRRV